MLDIFLSSVSEAETLKVLKNILNVLNKNDNFLSKYVLPFVIGLLGAFSALIVAFFNNAHQKNEKANDRIIDSVGGLFSFFSTCKDFHLAHIKLEDKNEAYSKVVVLDFKFKIRLDNIVQKREEINHTREGIQNEVKSITQGANIDRYLVFIDFRRFFNKNGTLAGNNFAGVEIKDNNALSLDNLFKKLEFLYGEMIELIQNFEKQIFEEYKKNLKAK